MTRYLLTLLAVLFQLPLDSTPSLLAKESEKYEVTAENLKGSGGEGGDILNLYKVKIVHGRTTLRGDNGIYYRKEEIVHFKGNVRIVDGTTVITAPEATYYKESEIAALRGGVKVTDKDAVFLGDRGNYYRKEERALLFGHARLEEKDRWLTAERISFFRKDNMVIAEEKVKGYEAANKSWIDAGRIDYDRTKKMAIASSEPVVTTEQGGTEGEKTEPMVIRGDKMTFFTDEKKAISEGNVTITREKMTATCGKATLLDKENKAVLEEIPVAWDEEGKVTGDTIEIVFKDNKVDKVYVRGNADIRYASTGADKEGESSKLSGDWASITMQNEEPNEVVAKGNAVSEYIPPKKESEVGERNKVWGDSVTVSFEKRAARTATVDGNGVGIYCFKSNEEEDTPEDTTSTTEVANYSGRRIEFDVPRDLIVISGKANLTYRGQRLESERVVFNSKERTLMAYGEPVLWDGNEKIVGDRLTYNIDTRKGTISSGRTTFEQGFYTGDKIKKVGEGVLDVAGASYTTCDLDHPHYRFSSKRMKVYVDDKVIAKPLTMYISNIPVIGLPFYVFPIKRGRHSGFLIPQVEIGFSAQSGRFLRNAGYYWAVNDYSDISVWGDYYEGTRWTTYLEGRYNVRYLLSGNLNSSYTKDIITRARRWDLRANHQQTLGDKFSLTMRGDFVSDKTYRTQRGLGMSIQEMLHTLLRSDVSVSKSWSMASMNLAADRRQDLEAGTVTQSIPRVSLYFSQRPIGRLKTNKKEAFLPWLSTTYCGLSLGMNNTTQKTPYRKTATSQISGSLSLSDSRKLLGWLDLSPSLNVSQDLSLRDPSGRVSGRTVSLGLYSRSTLCGVLAPRLGPLVAIRHIISPQVSYSESRQQMVFKNYRSSARGRFMTYSVQNRFQAKVKTGDKVRRLDNIAVLTFSRSLDLTRPVEAAYFPTSSQLQIRPLGPFYLEFYATHSPVKRRTETVSGTGRFSFAGVLGSKVNDGDSVTEPIPYNSSTTVRFSNVVGFPTTSFWIEERVSASPTKKWKVNYYIHYDFTSKEIASQGIELYRDLHCWETRFVRRYYGRNWEYYFRINIKALSEIYYERGTTGLGAY
ncbi:MAG: putative LPS assembly protein LptD [Candidatus Eisenbacteria bacterium]|nr:putative LPS assembly protein LptD [Candidatus Eisenbacteria bacterium]